MAAALRVGFAGTPPFAATALTAILGAGFRVVTVLTRPDRPQGRGLKLTPSAVKSLALERGLGAAATGHAQAIKPPGQSWPPPRSMCWWLRLMA